MYQLLTILEFDANFLYLVSHGHLSTQPGVNGTRNVLHEMSCQLSFFLYKSRVPLKTSGLLVGVPTLASNRATSDFSQPSHLIVCLTFIHLTTQNEKEKEMKQSNKEKQKEMKSKMKLLVF
jgi:propanediol utilization protein